MMSVRQPFFSVFIALAFSSMLVAQHGHPHPHAHGRTIDFPDVTGFLTLKADLHIHTVFSDGSVWPNIRVEEALRDGLDAISVTDHLEYQPHKDDIPHPDRNRSHEIATRSARGRDLIVIPGSEITRDMPPGHANAVFIQDANALLQDDPLAVFREAKRQGAFIFWNHPNWTAQRKDGVARLDPMHHQLLREDLLHGIEVVNEHTFSDEALQIALDHDLAIMGTSDIHGLIDWEYNVPEGGHRPVTLIFARERTAEGIKEALEARRTAVWSNNLLVGRERELLPLLQASLVVRRAAYSGDTSVLAIDLENVSDASFLLRNQSTYAFHADAAVVTFPPHRTTRLEVKTLSRLESISLSFEVLNAVTAPNIHPKLILQIDVE